MGGISMFEDWEVPTLSSTDRTLVLFGRTGNGKSATGNSILGREEFESKYSFSGVTTTSELQSTILDDGQVLNVIDTPGLFDLSLGSDKITQEIIKCIGLAKDGVDAVLLVLSSRTRFSEEEQDALRKLQSLFGSKIMNYVIVVLTNADVLKNKHASDTADILKSFPAPLKNLVRLCKNRMVLFDNETKDKSQRIKQVEQLMKLVEIIRKENEQSYSINDLIEEFKKGAAKELHDQKEQVKSKECSDKEKEISLKEMHKSYEELLNRMTEMVNSKLRECTLRLEMQLKEEHAARVKAEKDASDEIRKLRENLEKAEREKEQFRREREMRSVLYYDDFNCY